MHKLQKKRKSGSPLSEKAYKTRFDSFKFFYLVQNRFLQLSSLIKPNATLAGTLREKYVTRGMSRSIRNHKSQKGKKGKAERKKESMQKLRTTIESRLRFNLKGIVHFVTDFPFPLNWMSPRELPTFFPLVYGICYSFQDAGRQASKKKISIKRSSNGVKMSLGPKLRTKSTNLNYLWCRPGRARRSPNQYFYANIFMRVECAKKRKGVTAAANIKMWNGCET